MKKRIDVVTGGWRADATHNRHMAAEVFDTLQDLGYDARLQVLRYDELFRQLGRPRPDMVFPLAVGKYGEDGSLQAYLDSLRVPYVGSGAGACSVSSDKLLWKQLLESYGIKTAPHITFTPNDSDEDAFGNIMHTLGLPVILKPAFGAFSVGVFVAFTEDELKVAIKESRKYDENTLVERYYRRDQGTRELQVGFIGLDWLPISEYITSPGETHFSLDAKNNRCYDPGNWSVPASLPFSERYKVTTLCNEIRDIIGLKGYGRIDLLSVNGEYLPFDITAAPGAGRDSVFIKCAGIYGLTFQGFVEKLVKLAEVDR